MLSESESHSVMSNSLRLHGLYSPWNSPGQNTTVGSLSLLQWIFPTSCLKEFIVTLPQLLRVHGCRRAGFSGRSSCLFTPDLPEPKLIPTSQLPSWHCGHAIRYCHVIFVKVQAEVLRKQMCLPHSFAIGL